MRISRIAAHNFLSFESLDLVDLDPQLTVIVGPNGSGKSNLVRLLRVLRDAAGWPSNSTLRREELAQFQRHGTNVGLSMDVEFELTEDRERTLVVDFIRSAFLSAEWPSSYETDYPAAWQEWLQRALEIAPSFLFAGTLKVTLPDRSGSGLEVTYECDADGARLVWSASDGLGRANAASSAVGPAEAYSRARAEGSPPSTLSGLFGRGERIKLELRPDRLRDNPAILQSLSDLTGEELNIGGTRFYTGTWVFHHLFRQALNLTDNIRVPPRLIWSASDLARPPQSLSLSDGSELPLFLFRLKTGDSHQRERFQQACRLFHGLTGWSFDITFRQMGPSERESGRGALRTGLSRSAIDSPYEQGQEKFELSPLVQSNEEDVPIELAGAGAWEAAVLSAYLSTTGGVLVLDEPALNLHPVAQRRVLKALKSYGGQVLLVTHSPYMIPVDEQADLNRIVRFDLRHGSTRVNRLQLGSVVPRESAKLVRWLSDLTEVKALLFARGLILVEGSTELGALPTWFAKSLTAERQGTPDDLNLLVFNVGGDRNFGIFASLSAAFGIPWAIVCDAKAFGNADRAGDVQGSVFGQLARVGLEVDMASVPRPCGFGELKRAGEQYGIFTLAEEFDHEFEQLLIARYPQEYAAAQKAWPRSKVMAGRVLAQEVPCPEEVNDLYREVLDWLDASGELPQVIQP